jgi:hypothetical protein
VEEALKEYFFKNFGENRLIGRYDGGGRVFAGF